MVQAMAHPDRYSRQTILPEIGEEGQRRLAESSILCIGAGGLGSPALLYLAAAGVGRIGIVDFDRVEENNLQRQILFSTAQVGQAKAKAAGARLASLNPLIRIEAYEGELDAENAEPLFKDSDVILDGTDNFAAKFLINDAAVKFSKPWVYAAVQGFEAQISVFNHAGGPCYRCLYPQEPAERILNCAEAGVIGAVAGIAGVTQALQAIQIITGHESFQPLSGKLWTLDTRMMETRTLTLLRDPACPCCSRQREEIVLSYTPQACATDDVREIGVAETMGLADALFLDVREEYEWAGGAIEGAHFWPLSQMMGGETPDLPRDRTVVLYCQKGIRSLQAAYILKAKGVSNIVNLAGGYDAWRRAQ